MAGDENNATSGGRPGLGEHLRLTADDLLADLTWPRLLRSAALAMRPRRLLVCVIAVWIVGNLDRVARGLAGDGADSLWTILVSRGLGEAWYDVVSGYARFDPGATAAKAVTEPVGAMLDAAPVRALVLLPLMAALIVAAWGIVSRLAALDFARGEHGQIKGAAGDLRRRARPMAIAIVGPLVTIGALWLVLAVGGWALLSLPIVNVIGGVLAPVGWLIGLVLVVVVACTVLGGPMLVPAVMCEDEDGVEAVQRAFAYVAQRPLRLVLFMGVLIVQGVLLVAVASAIVGLATEAFVDTAGVWASERGRAVLEARDIEGRSSVDGFVAWLVSLTTGGTGPIVGGVALSYVASASTMLYLCMRRVVDGQDLTDLPESAEVSARIDATMAAWSKERQASGPSASRSDSESDDDD